MMMPSTTLGLSRLTTGNHPLYVELEAEIARFFGTETAVLTPTGYLSGLIAAQALKGTFSHALIDSRAHSALLEAAGLLECPMVRFGSRDPHDLEAAARRCGSATGP